MPDSGNAIFDPQARFLQLDERVNNVRSSLTHLEGKVDTGFAQLTSTLSTLAAEFRSGQKTQWPVILMGAGLLVSVLLGFGGAVGVLSLNPLKVDISENSNDIKALTATMNAFVVGMPDIYVPRRESERLSLRTAEERARTDAALVDLRGNTVSRAEWTERSVAVNQQISDMGRRIEEIRADLGAQYGVRDVILDLKREVDELRGRVPQSPLTGR